MDFEIFPDNVVNDKGDLVHFVLLTEAEPINHLEALRQELWKRLGCPESDMSIGLNNMKLRIMDVLKTP